MSKNRKGEPEAARRGRGDGVNQGEGDKASARRYNADQQRFVHSEEGQDAIEQAGNVRPGERDELEDAERAGRSRAKEEDPAVTREYRGSREP